MNAVETLKFEGNHTEIIGNTQRFTQRFRKALFDFNLGHCRYCGDKICDEFKMNIDHIIPKSKGGDDSIQNLGCSCSFCNKSKGSKDIEYLKFNIALKKKGLHKIITPKQAKELIKKGIDLGLIIVPFYFEDEK